MKKTSKDGNWLSISIHVHVDDVKTGSNFKSKREKESIGEGRQLHHKACYHSYQTPTDFSSLLPGGQHVVEAPVAPHGGRSEAGWDFVPPAVLRSLRARVTQPRQLQVLW